MDDQSVHLTRVYSTHVSTLRDVFAIGFRQRRLIILSFAGIFLGTVLAALLLPKQYPAHMKILVKRERVEPMVTAAIPQFSLGVSQVTEEELNSEVELLKTEDLLEKVVIACGLHLRKNRISWGFLPLVPDVKPEVRISRAVQALKRKLQVEPIKKTNLINVTYESPDPQLSARVLSKLATLYLEKHLAVHRPPGASDFFQQETERYRQGLAEAEARLLSFSRESGVVSAQVQKDLSVQKLNEFDSRWRQTQTLIAETAKRIQALEEQAASTPLRITAQIRTSENAQLMQQLKSTLLSLELKRTELMGKFEPSYRPVIEIETEIAQTKAAIAAADNAPSREETTDRNPVYHWVDEELAKSKAELHSLQARAAAEERVVHAYRDDALSLDRKAVEQQDLMRAAKTEEGNYLLYLSKREEARISDVLDSKRIVNVGVAEAVTVPFLPANTAWLVLLLGSILATAVSAGAAFVADYFDPCLRTPDEVQLLLSIPVLAAVPKRIG
jgi:uncharacterized protein involved in exopolysaccharide biosynthesis